MRIKVSEYIADFLVKNGVRTVFSVVGGGAMHLNNSLGHKEGLNCYYNHHEQASSMAAEAYFRVNGEMACICVTSGPGAINALNGVAGAYQDSIPMIVLSGQTKTTLTVKNSGLNLRTLGNQEFDIVPTLGNYTKYAEMITDPLDIARCLEKAFFVAKSGRPGPCWLDIPLDIQGSFVETENLKHYQINESDTEIQEKDNEVENKVNILLEKIRYAKRPVIYAGNGIRISGAINELHKMAETFQIPIVTCWDSIDLVETNSEYYVGRAGTMGDRAGNFAVQNSDLVIAIGSRLNIYQVGYQVETWAREAYVVCVDIDPEELKKKTVRIDLPICCDARKMINMCLKHKDYYVDSKSWLKQCQKWKEKYPVVTTKQKEQKDITNVYAFIDSLSRTIPAEMITVAANGSASVVGSAAYYLKKNQRYIMNCGISSMGYGLPASIGVCIANGKNPTLCLTGDGSIMMNLQELQTIVTNKLPIKVVIINNDGYHQIRLTQKNIFDSNFVGMGPDSHDLSFPSFEKIAFAFDYPYKKCTSNEEIKDSLKWMLEISGFCILEVFCDTKQIFEPKSATKKLKDGTLYSPPLEDLAPFLPEDELIENMYIKAWK